MSCPAWCERHTPAGFVGSIEVEEVHQAPRWHGSVSVALLQVGTGNPYLSFDSVDVGLRDAQRLASTMRRLGHPEIEASIRELLELLERVGLSRGDSYRPVSCAKAKIRLNG